MRAQAYLLAAGRGRRAGGPKAWLEYQGKPMLERQLTFLLGRFKPEDIAIAIQEGWAERCSALNSSVRWVTTDPDAPALASLVSLLNAAPMTDWSFLHHVDMPVWEPGLFDSLLAAIHPGTDAEVLIPAFHGRKGHPIVLSPTLGKKITALNPGKDRLDHWLKLQTAAIVDVPYSCVLENWNAPANAIAHTNYGRPQLVYGVSAAASRTAVSERRINK